MKRILLFLATNLAVVVLLGVVLRLLGVEGILDARGVDLNPGALLVYAASSASAVPSSRSRYRSGCQADDGRPGDRAARQRAEAWLLQTVSHQAQAAGIGMPEVAIFPSTRPTPSPRERTATRPSSRSARACCSRMKRDEVAAVLGHEVSHVANGDMITLTLIQGVVNTFVFFFARVIGYLVDQFLFRGENEERHGPGIGYFVVSILAQIVLGILASTIVFWFSRRREFRADAGGARLAGRDGMIRALERLKAQTEPEPLPDQLAAFGISGKSGGLSRLFMTHPPLEERIAALRNSVG